MLIPKPLYFAYTLAYYIEKFGVPKFIKVDVEGHEYEVLKTLDMPITLSFEFNFPEGLKNCQKALHHLFEISDNKGVYNYSIGENAKLELTDWVDFDGINAFLLKFGNGSQINFGDIYFRNG